MKLYLYKYTPTGSCTHVVYKYTIYIFLYEVELAVPQPFKTTFHFVTNHTSRMHSSHSLIT